MTTHRWQPIKIGVVFLLFALLPGTAVQAQNGNSPWQQFEKAAALFQQQAAATVILDLLREVENASSEPVLFGRAVFLASEVYLRENQLDKALLELEKFQLPGRTLPQPILCEGWLRRGTIYLKQGNIKSAKLYLHKVLESGSQFFYQPEAIMGLAWIAADQNQWQQCDSLLGLLENGNFRLSDERITILRARKAIGQDSTAQAIQLLGDTKSLMGLYFLARAYEAANNRIMAVSVYKKIHDLYPNTPEATYASAQAAEVFMRAGDWLAARSEFKRLLQNGLQNDDAIHFRLGWIYLNLNELEQALTEFRFVPSAQNSSYFKYMEAECLRRQGKTDPANLDKSIVLFHNIASVDLKSPLAPLAKLKAALTEMEKGDSTSALVTLRQFLSLYPKDELSPAVYLLLGVNENPANSQKYFDQIVQQKRDSQFFDVAYFALQNYDFTREDYQKVITRNASIPKNGTSGEPNYWQRANHLLLGESAYFLAHYPQALAEYELAVSSSQDDLTEKALIGKAWCKLQLAGLDTGLVLFDALRASVRGINRPLADYGYATVQFLRQDYTAALRAYPVSINPFEYPDFQPVIEKSLFRSAQCYYRLQFYLQAIETWNKLASDYPSSELAPEALFNIADVYFRANHFTEADSVYQLLISGYGSNPLAVESSLKLAQSAYNAGNYEEAVSRYQAFIEKYPDHEKNKAALEGIQLSYYQIGQTDQASEALQKVIETTSNSDLAIDARYRIATNYYQEKNYQPAVEAFKEILTLYPNSSYAVDAQFALSKCYLAQENYQSAGEELQRFIQYFPGSVQAAEAYFLLGVVYYQLESYLSAIDYFNKVITEYTDSDFYGPALKNSAWCYDRLQDGPKALQAFSTYLKQYPKAEDNQQIELQVARLLAETGSTKEAVTRFEGLQKSGNPEIALEACYRLGMLQTELNQTEKAERAFRMAADLNSSDNYYRLSSLAQLAAIYENRGEAQKAINTYQMLASSTSEERWTTAARERISMLQLQSDPNK